MAADLSASLQRGRAVQQITAFKDGGWTETAADIRYSTLQPPLSAGAFPVGKQIQLNKTVRIRNVCRADTDAAKKQAVIGLCGKGREHGFADRVLRVCLFTKPQRAVRVHRVEPPVKIQTHGAVIVRADLQTFVIIRDPPAEAVGDQRFPVETRTERIDHLAKDQAGLLVRIRTGQHLPYGEAVRIAPVAFDILHPDGLDAPGVIDQDLSVDPESLIKEFLIPDAAPGDLSHGRQVRSVQSPRLARPDLPEIGQRLVLPEEIFIRLLVQLRDPYAVFIRRPFLGHDIHGHLGQIQLGPDAHGGRDPGRSQHIADHGHGQKARRMDPHFLCLALIQMQIRRAVDKAFIHGIDVYVFRRDIAQIDPVDQCGNAQIFGHARPRDKPSGAERPPGRWSAPSGTHRPPADWSSAGRARVPHIPQRRSRT